MPVPQPLVDKDYLGRDCYLIRNGEPATVGDTWTSPKDGTVWTLTGGRAPHKSSSGGKVWLQSNKSAGSSSNEFFARVFDDAAWLPARDFRATRCKHNTHPDVVCGSCAGEG